MARVSRDRPRHPSHDWFDSDLGTLGPFASETHSCHRASDYSDLAATLFSWQDKHDNVQAYFYMSVLFLSDSVLQCILSLHPEYACHGRSNALGCSGAEDGWFSGETR
jgi:hypothetical protein